MKNSLTQNEIENLVKRQLEYFIPDGYVINNVTFSRAITDALDRCDLCFKHILLPGYRDSNCESTFSHLQRDQYATFLYYLANTMWKEYHDKWLCDKLLNLQSILHSFFLSYKCEMPNIFAFGHPIGTIIGNAKYSDGLFVAQNVTINTHVDENGECDLHIGKGCAFLTGSKIIGNQMIGDRVTIGANVVIYNQKIDNDYSCINDSGKVVIRPRKSEKSLAETIFDIDLY